ncbi:divergent PAP2 family protein [Candidatus Saccharibacteria bacterium]|jgi:acid phosphatase family membrane protein YuiD|nr:divergent PAP2 family protein [Candidatus Saccharibacteria bacterium]
MYAIAAACGYLVGSIAKLAVSYITEPKESKKKGLVKTFSETGGMPSGHSSTVMALAAYVALADGVWSASFGIAITLAIIVMTDAVNVRRATGENGIAIKKMLSKSQYKDVEMPYYARGHKPLEMFVGGTIGVVVGLLLFVLTSF